MDELLNEVQILKEKVKQLKDKMISEAQTKEWLIRPFFEKLGWDFSNPNDVLPEDDDSTGKRADYAFLVNNSKKLLVEAKSLSNPLTDEKMIKEKINYCNNSGVHFLVITNGEFYKVFYTELKGQGSEKLLFSFSLSDNINLNLIQLLSKEALSEDKLLAFAENFKKRKEIQYALENLFANGDNKLVNLINNTIKEKFGHIYPKDVILENLEKIEIKFKDLESTLTVNQIETKNKISIEVKETDDVKEYKPLKTEWVQSYSLYNKFIERLREKNFDFHITNRKLYTKITKNQKTICNIVQRKDFLKFYFTKDYESILNLITNELNQSKKIQYVIKISRWKTVNTKFYVKNEKDLDYAIKIFEFVYSTK